MGEFVSYLNDRFVSIRRSVRRHGLPTYVARLADDLRRAWFGTQVSTVFRRDLTGEVKPIDAKVPLTVEVYTPDKRDEVIRFLDPYLRRDVVERHLDEEGWIPMLGYHEGRLVALSWFSPRPLYVESTDMTLDYGEGCAYIEHTQTDESMWGKGIAPAIRTRICLHLQGQGFKEVYVSAGDDNTASQAVARKCGFVPHEQVAYVKRPWGRRQIRRRLAPEGAAAAASGPGAGPR